MQKFFKAVAFVTIFSVLTRALGFFLRIYLSRVMGAETLGAYQVAMSIFGVLMTLISSGLPLVVSRNVAYFNNQQNLTKTNKNITAGLIICVAISVVVCVLLAVCPNILKVFVKSQESVEIILILLPALVASAIYAILRGGLWGKKCFFTISFTEFFEQVVRIILCIILWIKYLSVRHHFWCSKCRKCRHNSLLQKQPLHTTLLPEPSLFFHSKYQAGNKSLPAIFC